MKHNIKKLLVCLAIPLAVGGLATLLSGGMEDYQSFRQPPLSPPGWVFPVVWTILYLLMGYASYRILVSGKETAVVKKALTFYGAQLAVNFLWPIVFFRFHWFLTAFFVLLLLWGLVYITLRKFSAIDEIAGDLILPYILWITFAGYLNLGVFLLN